MACLDTGPCPPTLPSTNRSGRRGAPSRGRRVLTRVCGRSPSGRVLVGVNLRWGLFSSLFPKARAFLRPSISAEDNSEVIFQHCHSPTCARRFGCSGRTPSPAAFALRGLLPAPTAPAMCHCRFELCAAAVFALGVSGPAPGLFSPPLSAGFISCRDKSRGGQRRWRPFFWRWRGGDTQSGTAVELRVRAGLTGRPALYYGSS